MDPFFSNIDDRIKAVVEDLPQDYVATKEDVSFFRRYTNCDDLNLPQVVINGIWSFFKKELGRGMMVP